MDSREIDGFVLKAFVIVSAVALFIGGIVVGKYRERGSQVKSDTVTRLVREVRVDTFRKYVPMPLLTRTLKETILVTDSTGNTMEVPRQQREYRDSTYHIWVSGYDPVLDSVEVYRKHVTETVERTITNRIYKKSHWHFGPAAGVGVDTRGRIGFFVGGAVMYSF